MKVKKYFDYAIENDFAVPLKHADYCDEKKTDYAKSLRLFSEQVMNRTCEDFKILGKKHCQNIILLSQFHKHYVHPKKKDDAEADIIDCTEDNINQDL